ncbi:MAG: type II toxin-antitoxin system RelE/ParE family toxin [Microcystis sp. M015S2]|jgi:toxin ParE1/3/4|uniref:type II toxin-antitoxin system RelE/ParE family toxin n=1 Tax=unclassified Microcystis TaxID=2643300 RepID=UPI001DE53A39|nr:MULTISPECIES: type II toxin-antitoxin system RelE/ParE family toxin [unclassified Microcystis]MCU7243864.1 type II toxin-antitoxin system RelE/ParE family toxin [Microcystis aeruginosa WS75]NCQ67729.1 type II toxin-antitoxin system RelE/ParE family toxin [Microcystis aeruginosa W13-16]NCQ72212.1 type II toxin-antitoxin system RelE/ParE family toxin [Microcystis aeruginosa W13-13]NCQ76669.1 type II toxin-antitoxin system RelE/ParE family toxin [Microcystis aeruginosa W13-15]NCR06888.1 type I
MSLILRSPQAKLDLKGIWFYIANDNRQRADAFLRKLDEKIKNLANTPYMGRNRDELMLNLRSFPVGSYVIFYRPIEEGIEVIRVLHSARDIEDIFADLDEDNIQPN